MALSCAAPVVELDAVSPIRSRTVVVTSTMLNRRIHPRGNLEAFTEAASEAKQREIHDLGRCVHFYTDYGVRLQQRFLGRFVKGVDSKSDRSTEPLSNATRASGNRNVALGSRISRWSRPVPGDRDISPGLIRDADS